MCGIAGVLLPVACATETGSVAAEVRAMLATMLHRGPDADGLWADPARRCVLGHRRLSIIDTSDAGRQPLASTDGRWVITFNGEIYNYRELTPAVAAAGMAPRGRTDTEVLANAIALWGTDALEKLDGQYAFAAFDTLTGRLILARDPFGEKPLYYLRSPSGSLAFASELQALERLPWFDGEVSADSVAELLMFQYVGAPRTIYKQVHKLQPGHWMVLDPGQAPRTGRYFRFAPGERGFTDRPINELADELETLLLKSIERRLIADVPLGAFLSGGVDSSTVCALVTRKLGRQLETFSIGFKGSRESEHETARRFARHLGTRHFDQVLAPSASEFVKHIGGLLDEPNADSSCMPTYLLSQFARKRVTVAVSGDGGDELFGGYGRYFATLDEERANQGRPWSAGSAYYADRILIFADPLVRDLLGALPAGLAGHLRQLRSELDQSDVPLFCRMRRTDVENYMPGAVLAKVDRMSMRHSLEVRTPFLNVELARFAERLPESLIYQRGKGKLLLRELAYRYLPRDLIDTPKQGFGLPMSQWARSGLLSAARELLVSEDSRLRAALGLDAMQAFLQRQNAWRSFATYQVWALAMLESWLRHHPARLQEMTQAVEAARASSQTQMMRALREASESSSTRGPDRRPAAVLPDAGLMQRAATLARKGHAYYQDHGALPTVGRIAVRVIPGAGLVHRAGTLARKTHAYYQVHGAAPTVRRVARRVTFRFEAALGLRQRNADELPPWESVHVPGFCALLDELVEVRNSKDAGSTTLQPGDHVMLVTHALPPGGAERQWCYLAQGMKAAGYRVTFLVTSELADDSAHHYPLLAQAGIVPVQLGSMPIEEIVANLPTGPLQRRMLSPDTNPFSTALALATGTFGALKPKAVFAQLDSVNLLCGVASLLADVPKVIFSFRNYSPARFSYIYKPWFLPLYQALARSRRVVLSGNSRVGNEDYAQWLDLPKESIAFIPNAVECEAHNIAEVREDALRQEFGFSLDTPVILGVFRLSEEKRPQLFVEVCAEVIKRHPATRALIAGVGPLAGAIRESIRARGLEGQIRLLGRRSDVECLMRISTLLLLTSQFEGTPNVVLEAQAAGLPVVASNVGGVADCIADGCSGFLVDDADLNGFVSHCLDLVQRRGVVRSMGRSGNEFMKNFSKEALARRHVALANGESDVPLPAAPALQAAM